MDIEQIMPNGRYDADECIYAISRLLSAGITPEMLEKLASGEASVMEWVECNTETFWENNNVLVSHYDEGNKEHDEDCRYFNVSCMLLPKSSVPCDHGTHYATFNGKSDIPTPCETGRNEMTKSKGDE